MNNVSAVPLLQLIPKAEFDRVREREPDLALLADMCRANALTAVKRAGSGHLGSSFSALDLVVHLLFEELNTAEARLGRSRPRRLLLVEGPRRARASTRRCTRSA